MRRRARLVATPDTVVRVRGGRQSGQGSVEYVGMVLLRVDELENLL